MILTYFVSMIHDSASTPDILVKVLTGEFMRKNYASSCLLSGELKLFVIVSFFLSCTSVAQLQNEFFCETKLV